MDVRDVADIHLRAMTSADAAGQRSIALAGGTISFLDMAKLLKKRLGKAARRVPTREMPDWMVRFFAHFIPDLKVIAPEVGKRKEICNDKARRVLGWTPRCNEEGILASAESLLKLGVLTH